jgi:serine/threonine protein kinase
MQDLARVRREIEFMSKLNHPHIIKILEGNNLFSFAIFDHICVIYHIKLIAVFYRFVFIVLML